MTERVLFCTVGGAHQPILTAIKSTTPRYVCFFCTGQDSETGKDGSIVQVTGKGKVIQATSDDAKPTLPNIPAQAGLANEQFEAQTIPADDLFGALSAMRTTIANLAARFRGSRLVADYTGGTKTMSAALVCAALERNDVELQLIAGARRDLVKVVDGTEWAKVADVAHLRLHRAMASALGAWRRFAYREAAEGLESIRVAASVPALQLTLTLSRALARWDDFDHGGAHELLEVYAGRVSRLFPKLLPTLGLLANGKGERRHPARLFDLWLNAERRAAQGRFDDAVARWYRLMEWTAQWQIRLHMGVGTKDFPLGLVPAGVEPPNGKDGTANIPLFKAWEILAASKKVDACSEFFRQHADALRHHLDKRNNSILAHGFEPVTREQWEQVRAWTTQHFTPLLGQLAAEAGLRAAPEQLPTEIPEAD